jgi:hypothetical protein
VPYALLLLKVPYTQPRASIGDKKTTLTALALKNLYCVIRASWTHLSAKKLTIWFFQREKTEENYFILL